MSAPRITTFTRDGLTFDVTDTGPLDGPPVILLHGFPTDRRSWDRVAPLLNAAGLRTLAPDQRGYSPGARPTDIRAYRLEELVADVVALSAEATSAAATSSAAAAHEKVHVVGHDWGGAIAWLFAGNHPERVASLTSLSTPHPAALSRAVRARDLDQLRRSWYMAFFQLPYLPERLLAAGFRSWLTATGLPPDDVSRYAARLASAEALTGPLAWYRAMRSSTLSAHRVPVPTTYVWGRGDVALGRRAAQLTREHVTGPYAFIELTAGHWLPETRPDECAAAIIDRVEGAVGSGG